MLLNLHTYLPPCILNRCCCLRPNHDQRRVSKTYRKLLKEISVERILRQLRVLNAAVRQSISREQWKYLRENHSLKAYATLGGSESKAAEDSFGTDPSMEILERRDTPKLLK